MEEALDLSFDRLLMMMMNDTDRGDPELLGEEAVSPPISTTNPTWIDCTGTPSHRCESTAIDRLSHRKAFMSVTRIYIMCNNYVLFLTKHCIFIIEKKKRDNFTRTGYSNELT